MSNEKTIISHLSKTLQAEYKKPEPNEIRVYELTGITKKKSKDGVSAYTVPTSRNIPDSYTVRDGDQAKSVVYTTKLLPTDNPTMTKRHVDPIEFRQEDMGRIRITPDNYAKMADIDMFLFFSPWIVAGQKLNEDTGRMESDRPWQMRDKLRSFIQLLDSRGKADRENRLEDMVVDAKLSIREMTEADMDIFVLQMKLGMPGYLTLEEKKNLLNKAVSKPKIAEKFLLMLNEEGMGMRRLIDRAVTENIISKSNLSWTFVDGGEVIVKKMPSKTMEDSLIFYFKTESGGEVKLLIEKTLDAKSAKGTKKQKDMATI